MNETVQELIAEANKLSDKAEELLTVSTETYNRHEHIDLAVALLDAYKQAMILVENLTEALEDQGYEVETTFKTGADVLLTASKVHLQIAEALR